MLTRFCERLNQQFDRATDFTENFITGVTSASEIKVKIYLKNNPKMFFQKLLSFVSELINMVTILPMTTFVPMYANYNMEKECRNLKLVNDDSGNTTMRIDVYIEVPW